MVTVVDYKTMENENGEEFFGLVVQGGIEVVKSAQTGRNYLTSRKATIFTTFGEVMCKSLIGTTLDGTVKKVICDPYDYTIPDSGEVVELAHRYEYVTDESEIVNKHVMDNELVA